MDISWRGNFRQILLICAVILLSVAAAVPSANATTIEFTGTIGVIEVDSGTSVYSSVSEGDTFSGRFTYGNSASEASEIVVVSPSTSKYIFDSPAYGGSLSNGSVLETGSGVEVRIHNNDPVADDEAVFLRNAINNLYGAGSVSAGDIVDSWGIDTGSDTGGDNFQVFGLSLVSLDTPLFTSTDFQALPPPLAQLDIGVFFIIEGSDSSDDIAYFAAGQLTSVTVVPDPAVSCGSLLTSDTTLDANLICNGTALFLGGLDSENVTLDCAGFSITSYEGAAISVFNTTGVEITNCNISTAGNSAFGIDLFNTSNSVFSNNTITTELSFGRGIRSIGSSNNLIDGNTISTFGIGASAISLRGQSSNNIVSNNNLVAELTLGMRISFGSNNNLISGNLIESGITHALSIESASDNTLDGNTFVSPVSFVRIQNMVLQNGGLSVDDAGNIFAVENNFGGASTGGNVTTMFRVDPNTGDAIPSSHIPLVEGGANAGFGFDSLEIMSDGRFLATRGGGNALLYEINPISGEVSEVELDFSVEIEGNLNGLQSTGTDMLLATTNLGELLSIDLVAGTVTKIGQDGRGWADLAQHPTSGRLFVTSRWRFESSGTAHLYEIDPATGDIIGEIGDIGDALMSDIDFSPGGVLYANNRLYTIDPATGLGTFVGGFGPDPFEPMSQNNLLVDQTFTATTEATVQFLEPINLPPSLLLNLDESAIQIGENSIFIDSAQFPFLDLPARIIFENLDGDIRDILVDFEDDGTFVPCGPPQCTLISFEDGRLIFDVAGFTTYTSVIRQQPENLEASINAVLAEIYSVLNESGISDKTEKKLTSAMKSLEKALNKLDKGDVKGTFKAIAKAVKKLLKAEKEGVGSTTLVNQLVNASRSTAQEAIDAAIDAGGKQKDIEKAESDMQKAEKYLGRDNFEKAIKRYYKAIKHVRKYADDYDA